ncbi:MAG: alpha/beta hydrolase [Magnetospirillum sp. WYHS-4]
MVDFRERRFTSRDGLSLYFRDYGDPLSRATPVLCLGGLTRNSKDFHGLALWLAGQGRRAVCPDLRGRGRSQYDPDWRNYHPATYVDDLRHLLAVAGLHRAVVVGTSLGGVLAMALGAAQPAALVGVALNDVGPVVARGPLAPIVAYMADDRPLASWDEAAAKLRATFPDWPAHSPEEWLAVARITYRETPEGLRHDWDPNLVRPLLAEAGAGDVKLWPLFHSLDRIPLLVLRGETSAILPSALLEAMAAARPDLRRAVIPNVGHAPGLAEPEARAALAEFLEKIP